MVYIYFYDLKLKKIIISMLYFDSKVNLINLKVSKKNKDKNFLKVLKNIDFLLNKAIQVDPLRGINLMH